MMIIYFSIGFFVLAAILGLTILIRWLQRKEASRAVTYSHGAVAIIAIVILVVYSAMHPKHFPLISLVLFPMGAIAGLYMFFTEKVRNKKPISVAFLHAFFVLCGLITLLVFVFRNTTSENFSFLS